MIWIEKYDGIELDMDPDDISCVDYANNQRNSARNHDTTIHGCNEGTGGTVVDKWAHSLKNKSPYIY